MQFKRKISLDRLKNRIDFRQEIQRYVLLLLLPLFFCIALYFCVQQITYEQLRFNAEHTVNQFYLQMSSMMHEADIINRALCSDFVSLSNNENGNLLFSYDNPSSICRQIAIRKESSSYINHIYFVSGQTQRIYSNEGYFDYNSLKMILWNLGIDYDSFFDISEQEWNMVSDTRLVNPYCITPFRDSENNITGYIIIALNLDVFINSVFDLNAEFACLYNDTTFITSHSIGDDYSASDLTSEKTVSQLLGYPVKCFYINVDDFTYMISMRQSTYYLPFTYIGVFFVIYAIVVFLSGYLYLYKVSKERYLQLSGLIQALPQESASLSYRDLVPAVQTALLESRDKSQAQLQTIHEHIFHDILFTHYKPSVMKRYVERIGLPTENAVYYVVIFTIKEFNNVALISNDSEDTNQMAWTIFQTAMEQFCDTGLGTFSCMDSSRFLTAFYSSTDEQLGMHVMAACESIVKFLNDEYGILLHAAISSAVTDYERLPDAFTQAKSLEKFSTAIGNSSRIISEDMLQDNSGLLLKGDFIRQLQMLANTLLAGKYNAVPSMVESILQEHVAPSGSNFTLAERRLESVANILAESLFQIRDTSLDVNRFAERLYHADSISALAAETSDIYAQLADETAQVPPSRREVEQACDYITDHLRNPNLNVTMICEAVEVIVQRLTPMFQEQLGMGIAEYVNYRRIEEAKKLLSSTKLTARQIAEEVGYSTTDTFTRNFRKLEHLTPTEYRRIVL